MEKPTSYEQQMEGTPENLVLGENEPEGIGTENLGPDTTYDEITGEPTTTPPEPVTRPENPFNPPVTEGGEGIGSDTPEWREETTANMQPLLELPLEQLFPFCVVYDLRLLWQKFSSMYMVAGEGGENELSTQASNRYEVIHVPFDLSMLGVGDMSFDIDLEPVATLLRMTSFYVYLLLMFSIVMSVIDFWTGILTGGGK